MKSMCQAPFWNVHSTYPPSDVMSDRVPPAIHHAVLPRLQTLYSTPQPTVRNTLPSRRSCTPLPPVAYTTILIRPYSTQPSLFTRSLINLLSSPVVHCSFTFLHTHTYTNTQQLCDTRRNDQSTLPTSLRCPPIGSVYTHSYHICICNIHTSSSPRLL